MLYHTAVIRLTHTYCFHIYLQFIYIYFFTLFCIEGVVKFNAL